MRVSCEERGGSVWRLHLRSEGDDDATLDTVALDDLDAILDAADAEDSGCRVLVLEGEAGRFCVGMSGASVAGDGSDSGTDTETDGGTDAAIDAAIDAATDAATGVARYASCVKRLRLGPPAVVAIVDGPALGGGLGLAAAADTVIGTSRARFGLPETRVGLLPAMVLPLVAERMPAQKARRLALGGPALDADEAARLGLVDRVVEDVAAAEKALFAELRQLLRLSPAAVAELRRFSASSVTMALDAAIDAGAAITSRGVADPDVRAAIHASLEGEAPVWLERPQRSR